MKKVISLISAVGLANMLLPGVAMAGDAAHGPSVNDLLFPAINFSLYLALMAKLLSGPVTIQLRARRDNMESFIKRAAMQWDQAKRQLLDVQRRFTNLDTELKELSARIQMEGEKEAAQVIADAETQAKGVLHRAKQSALAEANALEAEIRKDLAEEIVRLASEKLSKEINQDSDLPLRQRALDGLNGVRN